MEEEWRPIPGLPNYEASSEGRIRSLPHHTTFVGRWGVARTHFYPGKVLSLKRKPNGFGAHYLTFTAGHSTTVHVNRAVCLAFHGPAPTDRHEAAHLDRDTENNRPGNLCWATPVENAAHKLAHGTAPVGEANGAALLKAGDITDVFARYGAGESSAEIGRRFGVSAGAINQVIRRTVWAHVAVPEGAVAIAKARARENIQKARDGANAERSRLARGVPEPERSSGLRTQ